MKPEVDRRVAVVIPAYNAAAFICDALESVPTDEGVVVRIMVVDDGSTDDASQELPARTGTAGCTKVRLAEAHPPPVRSASQQAGPYP